MGFGAILHQGTGPLAFYGKPLATRHLKVATYERELIGLVQVMRHWRPYLWGHRFVVRTDHYALKYMLDQRLSTILQPQWISKLFGFNLTVEYRAARPLENCRCPVTPRAGGAKPSRTFWADVPAL